MAVLDFLTRVFGKDSSSSKNVAKERLRLVLVHDRANVSPEMMEALRNDLIKVISDYMEIDSSSLEVSLSNEDGSVALVANIPIVSVKRGAVAASAK